MDKAGTRTLWEKVFAEDTPEFLDYYYREVAAGNRIYTEEENGRVVSMVHANPYEICMGQARTRVSYLVAVATEEQYRHQGRMRRLLQKALLQARDRGEPFAFLMPASESIYYPFGFRTVRWQDVRTFGAVFEGETGMYCALADDGDMEELARFSQKLLEEKCRVFAVRDENYYRRIRREQEAVHGGILLLKKEGAPQTLEGYCFTGQEGSTEVWELAVRDPKDYSKALRAVTEYFRKDLPITVSGLLPGSVIKEMSAKEVSYRPMTMVRVVNAKTFLKSLRAEKETELLLELADEFLPENTGRYRVLLGPDSADVQRTEGKTKQTGASGASKEAGGSGAETPASNLFCSVTAEELAEAVFGIHKVPGISDRGIRLLHPVYFNELV